MIVGHLCLVEGPVKWERSLPPGTPFRGPSRNAGFSAACKSRPPISLPIPDSLPVPELALSKGARAAYLTCHLWLMATSDEPMPWWRWLAALFIVLTLTGCAQGITGRAGAPNTPHPRENTGSAPEHGGGDGGGGGGM
jgi:hypothetical protein